ncbi:MAG: hypothetical protein M1814_002288 [Vezdaea aestivalis]|nr:MAG: hypothetical protein M1814_002288 [Vezdaea aestivalis]
MATTEGPTHHPHDRNSRRRPFSAWMKRLASLKSSSSESHHNSHSNNTTIKGHGPLKSRRASQKNQPYPSSAHQYASMRKGSAEPQDSQNTSSYSLEEQGGLQDDVRSPPTVSNKSAAPTISTNPETIQSDLLAGSSAGATNATIGAREDSTFSSPAPSVRSLTTTLTTIQSNAAGHILGGSPIHTNSGHSGGNQTNPNFSHQFPSSPPASAVPPHLQQQSSATGSGSPTTYSSAVANNLLTDNASILTLASSSKRRRRHSLDTNASVRALAPSSLWGGSRESLPLSVLSANIDASNSGANQGGHQTRPSVSGLGGAGERASVYSASGIAPALTSERSSYYAGKAPATDGASMHSGFFGHSRNDSVTGSLNAVAAPNSNTGMAMPSPRETSSSAMADKGKLSRRGSGWEGVDEEKESADEADPKASAKKGAS